MPFQIIRNTITAVQADAIVNSANPQPVCAGGTDSAIYQAAGAEQLLAARREIGVLARGSVAVTPAFALQARYIIHTVGPVWQGGTQGEFEILDACYRNSLEKAAELGCASIAFPLIATGVYGFPKDRALQIAVSAISAFLPGHDMTVLLVVFDPQSFELSGRLFDGVRAFIDDSTAALQARREYGASGRPHRGRERLREEFPEDPDASALAAPVLAAPAAAAPLQAASLEEAVAQIGETFQQRLLRLIDASGMTDPEVYKRANLSRQHFSRIRSNPAYQPKRQTVFSLAIALRLNLDETKDLLLRAGYAFSPASRLDLAISYFITQQCYDVTTINLALFDLNLPLLGQEMSPAG